MALSRLPADHEEVSSRSPEAIHTFEGTATIQNLIVGRDITGVSAFTAGA